MKLLAILLLLAPAARADEAGPCATLNELDGDLISCGDNKLLAQAARECASALDGGWRAASRGLDAGFRASAPRGSQAASQAKTEADLGAAIAAMEKQIGVMERATDLVASYPDLMIDFPDSAGEDTSASCFNEAFHEVESQVQEMDRKIVQAEQVLESARAMRGATAARQSDLTGLAPAPIASAGGVPASATPGGRSPAEASDVTGLADELRKQGGPPAAGGAGKAPLEANALKAAELQAGASLAAAPAFPPLELGSVAPVFARRPAAGAPRESVPSAATAPSPAPLGDATLVTAALMRQGQLSEPPLGRRDPSAAGAAGAGAISAALPVVAGIQEDGPVDLFSRVHARYRSSALFSRVP